MPARQLDGDLGTEQERQVKLILASAETLGETVDDLLDLAKIEAKSFRLAPSDLPVSPILEHAIDLSEGQARRRRVEREPTARARHGWKPGA